MTNAEARFNKSLRPRKPEGSLGRTAQDVHLDSHTAPELWLFTWMFLCCCCNLMMFYDWCERVMSVLGTAKNPSATVLVLGNKVILYYNACLILFRW